MLVTNLASENYKAAVHGVMNFVLLKSKVLLELGKQDPSSGFKYHGNLEKLSLLMKVYLKM